MARHRISLVFILDSHLAIFGKETVLLTLCLLCFYFLYVGASFPLVPWMV